MKNDLRSIMLKQEASGQANKENPEQTVKISLAPVLLLYCQSCGSKKIEGKFCNQCGDDLAKSEMHLHKMSCPNCHTPKVQRRVQTSAEIAERIRRGSCGFFCHHCGFQLSAPMVTVI